MRRKSLERSLEERLINSLNNLMGMCEFKVILMADGKEEILARDIIKTSYKNGSLILTDVLGDRKSIPGALIVGLDVDAEILRVHKHEILETFLKFFETYLRCREGESVDELKRTWEDVKAFGDSMVNGLIEREEKP